MAEEKRAVILFADIQKSTEFGFTQPVERYNAMLREFHALARRVVDAYAEQHGLDGDRLMKGLKGDECCLFFLGGKPGQDEIHAINLAIRLKEEWKASDFSKRTRAAAEANLYPLADLRIGIGAGDIVMQYNAWAKRDTPEGIAISEAKWIEGMADRAENTLIMVSWEVCHACAKSNPELVFGDGVRLTGKGIPEGMNVPVFPVVSYDKWSDIQQEVVPTPEDPRELFDRALALQNSGDLDGAIASYQKSLDIKADKHEAWYNMGVAYHHKGDYNRAIECYQKALDTRANLHEAWYNLGNAYGAKGDYDRAIERYQKAVEIKPDKDQAWYGMGWAYAAKGEQDRAIECYQRAVEIKPDTHEAWNNMGNAYADKGDYDRAIECYQKALAIKPDKYEAWSNMGLAYHHKKDYNRAIKAYQKAVAIKPDFHQAWNNMGAAYSVEAQHGLVVESLASVIESLRHRFDAPVQELDILITEGIADEARYQELLERHPWVLGMQYKEIKRHFGLDDKNIPDFTGVRVRDGCSDIFELKPPKMRLFRRDGSFTSEFNDAWNQAEKYLGFVRKDRDYLHRKGMDFDNPKCILIVGWDLSLDEKTKIKSKEGMNLAIECLTYNDLRTYMRLTAAKVVEILREHAKTASDFDPIRNDPAFRKLVYVEDSPGRGEEP